MVNVRGCCLFVAGLISTVFESMTIAGASESAVHEPDIARFSIEAGIETFRWQEFNTVGGRLLTEQGPRLVLAAALHNLLRPDSGILFTTNVKGYGGQVDYDGQDTSGQYVATTSGYWGWSAEIGGGYRSLLFTGDSGAIDLLAGVGVENWGRDIHAGANAFGQPVQGLLEEYSIVYTRAGMGLAHRQGAREAYLHLGFRYPVYTDEYIRLNGDDVNLSPGRRASGFISYRISLSPASDGRAYGSYLELYYDSYRFSRSDVVVVSGLSVWQPRSSMDILGARIGFAY